MSTAVLPCALPETEWTARAAAHEARMERWLGPHRERRRSGRSHPVLDFLFTYYSEPPGRLRRWHPGVGAALSGPAAAERRDWPFYAEMLTADGSRAVGVDVSSLVARRGDQVRRIADLLEATAGRSPSFDCFGLHEWAMVYRPDPGGVRHDAVPLRLGADGTAAVVDAHRVHCSHVDAYRFFSRRALPLNTMRPTRANQRDLEQPGCLHATMDLYKWAYKLGPAVPGELLADCFELAVEVRELDMRASPYDLADHGYAPVAIETPEGKAEYVAAQREFARRGADLRGWLLAVSRTVLDQSPSPG